MTSGAVCLRATPGPRELPLSGDRTDDARTSRSDSSAGVAAGLGLAQVVPWPVLVTQEWLAIVGWSRVATWAIVLVGIVGILIGAFVAWRKGEG